MYQKNWGAEEECYICTEGTAVHWKYYFCLGFWVFFPRSGPSSLISNSYSSRSFSLKSRIIGPFPQDSGLLGVVSTLGL